MQLDLTYSCGCREIMTWRGSRKEAEKKKEYTATIPCKVCAHKDENEAAAAASGDLPSLTGSEKQVPWAVTIRHEMRIEIEKWRAQMESELARARAGQERQYGEMWEKWIQRLMIESRNVFHEKTEAKFWIDNRLILVPTTGGRALAVATRNLVEKFYDELEEDLQAGRQARYHLDNRKGFEELIDQMREEKRRRERVK